MKEIKKNLKILMGQKVILRKSADRQDLANKIKRKTNKVHNTPLTTKIGIKGTLQKLG